jgi:hypothetical protein
MVRLPEVWGSRGVHVDPDLLAEAPTYGDNCRRAARAFALRRAEPEDRIVFIARLHPQGPRTAPGFYLVGQLDVLEIACDVTYDPGPGWWDGNAHVRRARAGAPWDSFWVFRGGPASRLYRCAVPFSRVEADRVFGGSWLWRETRTELQTIGSYTRTVRRLEGAAEEQLRSLCPS